jgi:putative transferase (TIGR04331 family)
LKSFLVTTPLKETWPSKDKKIVLLGDWCTLYDDHKFLNDYKYTISEYHWNDRSKLKGDFDYLNLLFEKILPSLALKFNKIHKVNYDIRYWKIILGPWLMVFLSISFDRWESIRLCFEKFSINKTIQLLLNEKDMTPVCMKDFSDKIETDEWNHYLFSEIINYVGYKIEIEKINQNKVLNNKNDKKKYGFFNTLKSIFFLLSSFPAIYSKIFVYHSYLEKKEILKLHLKLNQIPFLDHPKDNFYKNYKKENYRGWALKEFNDQNNYENFICKNINKFIPCAYLENFHLINKLIDKKFWPKKPKVIFTSNAHYMDETFKFWAASKIKDFDAKLVIGQHGGHWGQGSFNFTENYEISISDKFLSWGWTNENKKVFPMGNIKPLIKTNNKKKKDKLIFILLGTDRYSHNIQSIPISSQWLNYFNYQIILANNLNQNIKKNIYFKLYPYDYKWNQSQRLKDNLDFNTFKIIKENVKYKDIFKNCRLTISGWNSTTFLETMSSNIPTIIFWDEKYFELRETAKDDFKLLKKAKIFFDNPHEASKHINKIWDNIDLWWYDEEIIKIRNLFTSKYSNTDAILKKIAKELNNC